MIKLLYVKHRYQTSENNEAAPKTSQNVVRTATAKKKLTKAIGKFDYFVEVLSRTVNQQNIRDKIILALEKSQVFLLCIFVSYYMFHRTFQYILCFRQLCVTPCLILTWSPCAGNRRAAGHTWSICSCPTHRLLSSLKLVLYAVRKQSGHISSQLSSLIDTSEFKLWIWTRNIQPTLMIL